MKEPKPSKTELHEHMAYFYKNIKTEEYRRQLKAFWIQHYGSDMTNRAIAIAERKK